MNMCLEAKRLENLIMEGDEEIPLRKYALKDPGCDWEARVAGCCPTYHTCTGCHQIVRCSGAVYCRCGVYMDSFLLVRFVEIKKKEDEE